MSLNDITTTQNATPQIKLLRARRQIYRRAKFLLSLQIILSIGVPLLGTALALAWVEIKPLVAFLSLIIAILDVTFLDRMQTNLRKIAAKLQEQFDCTVLLLPWDDFTVGKHIDPELVHSLSSRYLSGKPDPKLFDWYPTVVGEAPIHLARIICQRTNLWYDAMLRRCYGAWVLGIASALVFLMFVVGIAQGVTLSSFVVSILAPAAPIIIWSLREYFRQRDVTEKLDAIRNEAEKFWERAKSSETESACTIQSREFQNAIFERRSSSPLIFDWLYKIMRDDLEDQMNQGAEHYIHEITNR